MKYPPSQAGFSLVETLVAITILLIVIVGPMTISSSTAKSTSFSSEQVTAFFLAQEGAELVQKARDDLLVPYFADNTQTPWATFSNTSGTLQRCYAASGCGLEINTNTTGTLITPISCATITNCQLYRNDSTGAVRSRFTHTANGNTLTPFTRKITLTRINSDEVSVVSTVTWRTGSLRAEQQVSVETRLFNMYGS